MFRFSLHTLVLLSLWIGTAMLVWKYRAPWIVDEDWPVEHYQRAGKTPPHGSPSHSSIAPDGKRQAILGPRGANMDLAPEVEIHDGANVLARFDCKVWSGKVEFIDDNRLICVPTTVNRGNSYDGSPQVFRRRFPEHWWGHLLRPELWLLCGLTVWLIRTFVRHVSTWHRARRARHV